MFPVSVPAVLRGLLTAIKRMGFQHRGPPSAHQEQESAVPSRRQDRSHCEREQSNLKIRHLYYFGRDLF